MTLSAILSAVALVALVRGALNLLATALGIRFFLGKPSTVEEPPKDYRLAIILPVFEEEARIGHTMSYLAEVLASSPILECIVVGTARERDETGSNRTLEAARASPTASLFTIVETADPEAIKADQINFAAYGLRERHPAMKIWVLFVDIDSRFRTEALAEARHHFGPEHVAVQQHAVFLADYEKLPLLQKAHALYQSRWTISHEVKNNWLSYRTGYYVSHIVGHGAFIDLDTLVELGGFPTKSTTEDLHFGYYLVASGGRIRSLQTLEMAETPDTTKAAMLQQKAWAFGPLLYGRYRRAFARDLPLIFERNRLRSAAISFFGLMTFANWLFLFPVLALVMGLAAAGQPYALAALLAYLSELILVSWFLAKRGWLTPTQAMAGPVLMLVHTPIRCVAAWRALVHVLQGKAVSRHKTVNRAA